MVDSIADCLARANQARAAADAEPLENARAKHIASAEAWEAIARKAQRMAEGRASADRAKADAEAAAMSAEASSAGD